MFFKRLAIVLAFSALILLFLGSSLHAQTFTEASHLFDIPADSLPNPRLLGASAADINGDGWTDIYHPGRLYQNEAGQRFVDVLASRQINEGVFVFGALFGDYDNDGDLDVFFEDFDGPSQLYENTGNGFFALAQGNRPQVAALAQTAAWVDYDRNGTLDLFVSVDDGNNQLFKNAGQRSFEDVSSAAGIAIPGAAYGMSWADYNQDGYPDVFIAACSPDKMHSVNHLFENRGDGTFADVTVSGGVLDSLASWGVVWLDVNNDARSDLYISNSPAGGRPGYNTLYLQNQAGTFDEVGQQAQVAGDSLEISIGVAAADFDNDGWVDLYVANTNRRHRLYRNNGDGTFRDVADEAGITTEGHSAVAVADYNNDGWLDIYTVGYSGHRLMLNDGGPHHWISIKTHGKTSNYFGVGTQLTAYSKGLSQLREIRAGDSYVSQNDLLVAHFGLGSERRLDSLTVVWPSGIVDHLVDLEGDQHVVISEDEGITTAIDTESPFERKPRLGTSYPNPFSLRTTVQFELPERGFVTLKVYDMLGREVATLAEGVFPAGVHRKDWIPTGLSSGVYVYKLEFNAHTEIGKMMVVR